MPERTSKGSTQPVMTNDTDKASLPAHRLERHAGKLARAVLRGGGDGDTASLPDRPLRPRFRQRLSASVIVPPPWGHIRHDGGHYMDVY
jgi:hypothetical protein